MFLNCVYLSVVWSFIIEVVVWFVMVDVINCEGEKMDYFIDL